MNQEETMKLERLLAITTMLLNNRRVSAAELADRFEVSLRTIYRDMETINRAGIPIVSFVGSEGGYEVMDGYRLDRQYLSLDELQSLTAALRGMRSATEDGKLDRLLDKLGALLPIKVEPGAGTDYIDVEFAPAVSEKEKLRLLQPALKAGRIVSFRYVNAEGEETDRKVEPMALFFRGSAWYLYGYCLSRRDYRIFRLSRMSESIVTEHTFERRSYSSRDIEARWELRIPPPIVTVTMRFRPIAKARVLDDYASDNVRTQPDGSLLVSASYTSFRRLVREVLSYGSDVEVLEPDSVRQELYRYVSHMAAQYAPM
jgi:predicted DNA-binding transcriptional regulator YafY